MNTNIRVDGSRVSFLHKYNVGYHGYQSSNHKKTNKKLQFLWSF